MEFYSDAAINRCCRDFASHRSLPPINAAAIDVAAINRYCCLLSMLPLRPIATAASHRCRRCDQSLLLPPIDAVAAINRYCCLSSMLPLRSIATAASYRCCRCDQSLLLPLIDAAVAINRYCCLLSMLPLQSIATAASYRCCDS